MVPALLTRVDSVHGLTDELTQDPETGVGAAPHTSNKLFVDKESGCSRETLKLLASYKDKGQCASRELV